LIELRADRFVDPFGRRVGADLDQQPHDVGIRAAVERALERADRADRGRIQVRQGGRGHAGGECRGVQLVVGVEHERDVERARRQRVRALAFQHVEKVRGVPERRVRLDVAASGLQAAVGSDNAAHLGRQADRLPVLRLGRAVVDLGVVLAQRRRQGPQHVHPVGCRQLLHQPEDGLGHGARGRELRLQIPKLGAVRQAAMPQQVADLFERRPAREVVNVIAVVRKNAAIPIQVTDGGGRGDYVFQAGFGFRFVYSHNSDDIKFGAGGLGLRHGAGYDPNRRSTQPPDSARSPLPATWRFPQPFPRRR
jgi:hypothetical protein